MTLNEFIAKIKPLDAAAMQAARDRQNALTKPQGSLGRLEELSIQVAGITGQPIPTLTHKVVTVMAGDHGVVAEGVSAYPQEVTPQMVLNFLHGGAAINVLALHVGARVVVLDMGVASDLPTLPGLMVRKVAYGTGNIAHGPAMTREQAMMNWLGVSPMLDLKMRLGEGTGAALAMSLVEAACKTLAEMATFGQAGVSEKEAE